MVDQLSPEEYHSKIGAEKESGGEHDEKYLKGVIHSNEIFPN